MMNVHSRLDLFLIIFSTLLAISVSNDGICQETVIKTELRLKYVTRTRMGQKLECVNVWSNYCRYVPRLITESVLNTVPEDVEHIKDICCTGYEEIIDEEDPWADLKCKPKCTYECINGSCVEPEVCECKEGYEIETNHTCKPICKNGCTNSICIDVNHCQCLPNYIRQNESICIPKCDKPCINGTCIKPNICECKPHHSKKDDFVCEPECELNCTNGKCIDVNTCGCDDGYELRNNTWHICDPVCLECQNGYCALPNNCSCFEGYEPDIEKSEICNPICNETCINGFCSEPNICSCNKGHGLVFNQSNMCEPICENNCEQGFCAEPNVCECFSNYIPETSNKCVPYCENGCINGDCAQPSYCECNIGTIKVNSSYCANVCDGNTTEECYHVAQTFQEHPIMSMLDHYVINFPKNHQILTYNSLCVKNIKFDCILDKLDDAIYGICQTVLNDTGTEITPQSNLSVNAANQTYITVNFTFIYEKENTTELCKMCFCDNYDIEVNTGNYNTVTLCPCQDIIQTNKLQSSHVSVLHVVVILGCSVLAILGIVAVLIRKKRLEGEYGIDTNIQESALIEEEL